MTIHTSKKKKKVGVFSMHILKLNTQNIFTQFGHWLMDTFNISEHMIRDLIVGGVICVVILALGNSFTNNP